LFIAYYGSQNHNESYRPALRAVGGRNHGPLGQPSDVSM
jgi:hypothetical protein